MAEFIKKIKTNAKLKKSIQVFLGRGLLSRICLVILVMFILVAIFAPYMTPYNPNSQNLRNKLAFFSSKNLLGTDHLGRDMLSRIIYGARISLQSSLLAGLFAAAIGILLGLLAGFYGGALSTVILRLSDAQLAIPGHVFTLAVAAVMGGGLHSIVIAIGIGMVPTYVRMMNGLVLSCKENDYVTASLLTGESNMKVLFKHLLPNCFPSLIVLFTMNLGNGIMMEATLSYLGVGIAPPTASWGSMVYDGYKYLTINPWISIIPGIAIILVIISFNVVGDGLRDALDPRLKGRL